MYKICTTLIELTSMIIKPKWGFCSHPPGFFFCFEEYNKLLRKLNSKAINRPSRSSIRKESRKETTLKCQQRKILRWLPCCSLLLNILNLVWRFSLFMETMRWRLRLSYLAMSVCGFKYAVTKSTE
ncbi:CLUMA_CG002089, isoform A [Clunio marinus]|uniref:CLUMA_CG002089, isoform A n=1 Tax=Clunio marinus TaxID=568069 RepID=A0A1J1HPA9_9DIPT|nr:CLUMA_CG002089, isoform A [Clunio marinus]